MRTAPEMTKTTIIRHPREKRAKCSLTPLEGRADLRFLKAGPGFVFDAADCTVLDPEGPELTEADAGRELLLLDSTWRLLPSLRRCLRGAGVFRSLPAVPTAYPRRSKLEPDPPTGLASVEALYLARLLLGDRDDSLLDHYRWRGEFLAHLNTAGFLGEPDSGSARKSF